MLTASNAEIFGKTDYGLEEGHEGSLVVFDSPDAFNALRTRAPRTLVLRDGDIVARTDPGDVSVHRTVGTRSIDFHR